MPLPPEHYIARAADMERAASQVFDANLKREYLKLAAQFRDMAERAKAIREKCAELDKLAENMAANPKRP